MTVCSMIAHPIASLKESLERRALARKTEEALFRLRVHRIKTLVMDLAACEAARRLVN